MSDCPTQIMALMSDRIESAIPDSGVIENMGVAAGTASKSIFVQKLFLLPVYLAAILNFGHRSMSGHVFSVISEDSESAMNLTSGDFKESFQGHESENRP